MSQRMKHPHLPSQKEVSIFFLSRSQAHPLKDTKFRSLGHSQPTLSQGGFLEGPGLGF